MKVPQIRLFSAQVLVEKYMSEPLVNDISVHSTDTCDLVDFL